MISTMFGISLGLKELSYHNSLGSMSQKPQFRPFSQISLEKDGISLIPGATSQGFTQSSGKLFRIFLGEAISGNQSNRLAPPAFFLLPEREDPLQLQKSIRILLRGILRGRAFFKAL
jgi:hypothetical protein